MTGTQLSKPDKDIIQIATGDNDGPLDPRASARLVEADEPPHPAKMKQATVTTATAAAIDLREGLISLRRRASSAA